VVIKKPTKSKGIPKQKDKNVLYNSIERTFLTHFDHKFIDELIRSVKNSNFWKESLARQTEILSQLFFDSHTDSAAIIKLLKNSPSEYIRGSSGKVVLLAYNNKPEKCCVELKSVGKLDGTWPQEDAQAAFSKLMSKHGVKKILSFTLGWLYDSDERVRRMLVEALRPRGVWVEHLTELKEDPSLLEPILHTASDDKSLYVRKAAANNINDICKDNPNSVIKWTASWLKNATEKQKWTIERGLRSLLRENHPDALALLGYNNNPELKVKWLSKIDKNIKINTLIPIEVMVSNLSNSYIKIRLHARLLSPGKGKKLRSKHYILSSFGLKANDERRVLKNIHFVDFNSQPKLPGVHTLTLYCNGNEIREKSFYYQE